MKKVLAFALALVCVLCCFASCGKTADDGLEKITVAATSTPHAEILEKCKDAMKEKGFNLVIKVVDDYVTPNTATEDGDVDANYFQHTPYLDSFNEEYKTHLVSVATVHYEPLGLYAGSIPTIDGLTDGAKIAVPNDTTNEARALQLLAAQGLLELKEGVGLKATKKDITSNPKNIQIVEMEAALIAGVLDDVAMGVINGNYALEAKLNIKDALATESADSEAAKTFGNVLVVKAGNEEKPAVKALVEILKSQAITDYINQNYSGAVVPMK